MIAKRTALRRVLVGAATVAVLTSGGGVAQAADPWPAPGGPQQIVGGRESTRLHPGVASLQITHPETGEEDFHTCSAGMYSPTWAFVPAHCVTQAQDASVYPASWNLHLRVGSLDNTTGGVVVDVDYVVPHQNWTYGAVPGTTYDMAMLKLASPVHAAPMPVASRIPAVGQSVRLTGWGRTDRAGTGPTSPTLREIDARRLPDSRCAEVIDGPPLGAGEFCVYTPRGGACAGDSGGQGLLRHRDGWTAAGMISRDVDESQCGISPTILTSLPHYADWMAYVARHGHAPPAAAATQAATPAAGSRSGWAPAG